jgi:hypothetical protein
MVTFRRQLWSLARTSPNYAAEGVGPVYTDAMGPYGDLDDDYDDDLYADEAEDELDPLAGGAAAVVGHARPASGEHGAGYRRERAVSIGGSYRRRRRVLAVLAGLACASVAPAVVLGGAWWVVQGATGGLLVTYLSLLVQRQRRLIEQARKVHYLAPIQAPRPPVVVLGSGVAR